MKKTKHNMFKIAIAIFLVAGHNGSAQVYFQHVYPSTAGQTNEVSTAICTYKNANNPPNEFVIGSYQTSSNSSSNNFEIRRIDGAGDYINGGPPMNSIAFFDTYKVYLGSSCNGPSFLVDQTYGISVIETGTNYNAGSEHYAVVGAVGLSSLTLYGCFFALLTVDGMVMQNLYFDFPFGASSPTKPLVYEDVNVGGNYYISGSYFIGGQQVLYVLKIDPSLSIPILWSQIYSSGFQLMPYDMMQSPFDNDQLILVGKNLPDPSQAPFQLRNEDGFFMRLAAAAGTPFCAAGCFFQVYGVANSALDQYFTSLTPANSTWGGFNGFAIGGMSNPFGGYGRSWMLKLDQSGTPLFNTLISGSNGSNAEITGIIERLKTTPPDEYYGATSTGMGQMTVFKLDESGVLWTNTSGNEFEYTFGGGGPAFITQVDATATNGLGFQVFGTAANDNYMVKAYYNGVSGTMSCTSNENYNTISSQGPGPNNIITPACPNVTGVTWYNPCSDFYITSTFYGGDFSIVSVFCTGNPSPPGSNARQINGIAENSKRNVRIDAYPSPAIDLMQIDLQSSVGGKIAVSLYNNLSQAVKVVNFDIQTGDSNLEIDVSDLVQGVYILQV